MVQIPKTVDYKNFYKRSGSTYLFDANNQNIDLPCQLIFIITGDFIFECDKFNSGAGGRWKYFVFNKSGFNTSNIFRLTILILEISTFI